MPLMNAVGLSGADGKSPVPMEIPALTPPDPWPSKAPTLREPDAPGMPQGADR